MRKQSDNRLRRVLAWTLAGALLGLLGLWLGHEAELATSPAQARGERGPNANGTTGVTRATGAPRPGQRARSADPTALDAIPPESLVISQAPLIGDVTLEKPEVCPHEELTITVAPMPGAEGATFNVEGKHGGTVVVTPSLPGEESFWIVAAHQNRRDFREVVVGVLPEDHPRCARAPRAELTWEIDPWQPGKVELEVVPVRNLSDITEVRWSFGDGQEERGGARITHAYSGRSQAEPVSTFVVEAAALDREGRAVRARASLALPNLHRQARALSGYRGLPAEYDRFAAVGGARAVPG
jgi:hypothetical protein